jgi:hypothetical protein
MNMENMCLALAADPELFAKMISNLADDYIAFFNYLSREGVLLPTVENELLGQGTYSYTDELPDSVPPGIEFTQRDVYTVNSDVSKVKRYVDIIRSVSGGRFS